MTVLYKTDHRGRSTNQVSGTRMKRALGLPSGVGWNVALPGHLLRSPSWIVLPLRARQASDGIMSEFAEHGGKTNGQLIVPYRDLQARMRRSSIKDSLVILEAVGLIVAERDTRSMGTLKRPTLYRLTWLGTPNGLTATHDWKAIQSEDEANTRMANALARLDRARAAALRVRKARARQHPDQADAA